MIVSAGIALGSNLGDRAAELNAGLSFLRSLSVFGRLRESNRVETHPLNCPPGSPLFLNMVAEIELDPALLPPRDLLRKLQAFEVSRGRPADHEFNAPRSLDLDIIYYGNLALNERDLVIPHPRATTRLFVLEPLATLRPELVLPGQTRTVAEFLAELTE